MGSVEHDLSIFEAEQDKADQRYEYGYENRDRFMDQAIEEEVRKDFPSDLAHAADKLADGMLYAGDFINAYLAGDDLELGRLIRRIVSPVIKDFAVDRAERMALEEFDGLENQHRVKE